MVMTIPESFHYPCCRSAEGSLLSMVPISLRWLLIWNFGCLSRGTEFHLDQCLRRGRDSSLQGFTLLRAGPNPPS